MPPRPIFRDVCSSSDIFSSRAGHLRLPASSFYNSTIVAPVPCLPSLPSSNYNSTTITRHSSSSTRWANRQARDSFGREARVQGLKSRAAFKLLQINDKYRLFKRGQTVVDLGYAPGSWSQVAIERTQPGGRVLGIDLIPAQPPKGVSTIQGNFLSPDVRADVKAFLRDSQRGRLRKTQILATSEEEALSQQAAAEDERKELEEREEQEQGGEELPIGESYIDRERKETSSSPHTTTTPNSSQEVGAEGPTSKPKEKEERMVDIVLSDMSEPWEQTTGFHKRSISDVYRRLMNTSGNNFRDHAGSMDLCRSALEFTYDVLKPGGHFVCKFYQGAEDKGFEMQLKKLFGRVLREKPESSRSESKEAYFVAIRRLGNAKRENVFPDG